MQVVLLIGGVIGLYLLSTRYAPQPAAALPAGPVTVPKPTSAPGSVTPGPAMQPAGGGGNGGGIEQTEPNITRTNLQIYQPSGWSVLDWLMFGTGQPRRATYREQYPAEPGVIEAPPENN